MSRRRVRARGYGAAEPQALHLSTIAYLGFGPDGPSFAATPKDPAAL